MIRQRNPESGVAVLEMAMVTPLFLLLILAGIEYARALERIQWATQLSREVASIAYRLCPRTDPAYVSRCLQLNVVDKMKAQVDVISPGTEFVVAAFTYDAAQNPRVRRIGIVGPAAYRTKFEAKGFSVSTLTAQANANIPGSAGNSLRLNEMIVIAVAFIPSQSSVVKAVPGARLLTFDEVYATSIM